VSGDFSKRWTSRTLIALVLCFLAVTFAVEAKMAWYLPPHTMGSQVQAAKALPADMRQIILHGLPDHHPIFPFLPLTLLLAAMVGCWPVSVPYCGISTQARSPLSTSSFSLSNFLRPPPVR
jgi:hypothetical protein